MKIISQSHAAASAAVAALATVLVLVSVPSPAQAQSATITVQPTVAGATPEALGYNLGHFMPGSNAADWFRYSGVKAARIFISSPAVEPNARVGDGVADGTSFFSRRAAFRANAADSTQPLDTAYTNWPAFYDAYENRLLGGTNRFKVNYAFGQLRALGVEILVNLTAVPSRFPVASDDDWAGKWELWRHYYTEAFYFASAFDVRRFSMFNEPNGWPGMTPPDWNRRLMVCSDAMQSAITDVNSRYGKSLTPQIFAPNTANAETKYFDWGQQAILNRHLTLAGDIDPAWNNLHYYNYQQYGRNPATFANSVSMTRALIASDLSGETAPPIALTEFNASTAGNLDLTPATLDDPQYYASLGASAVALTENLASQLYLFKFAQTERTGPYGVTKNGTHYVDNASDASNYGGATKVAEVYRLFVKAVAGGRMRLDFLNTSAGAISAMVTKDSVTGDYSLFATNNGISRVQLDVDVSALALPDGRSAIVEEVSTAAGGAVSMLTQVTGGHVGPLTMLAQSVWLVSIPNAAQSALVPAIATTVLGDGIHRLETGGDASQLLVRSDGTADGRRVALMKFPVPAPGARRILLGVSAATISQPALTQVHVYGLNDSSWSEDSATWAALPADLLQGVASGNQIANNVVAGQGMNSFMLGQLVMAAPELGQYWIDVTDFVGQQNGAFVSFLLVQDHRWNARLPDLSPGDTQADGIRVLSRRAGAALGPRLMVLGN